MGKPEQARVLLRCLTKEEAEGYDKSKPRRQLLLGFVIWG